MKSRLQSRSVCYTSWASKKTDNDSETCTDTIFVSWKLIFEALNLTQNCPLKKKVYERF